jgi:hypothetical protein
MLPVRAEAAAPKKRVAFVASISEENPAFLAEAKADFAAAFAAHGFREGENLEIRWFEYPARAIGERRYPTPRGAPSLLRPTASSPGAKRNFLMCGARAGSYRSS